MSESTNLDEIAVQELLNEAKRGAVRASVQGALGWQKCPLAPTNKRFLNNILVNTLHANRIKEKDKKRLQKPSSSVKDIGRRSRSPKARLESSTGGLRKSDLNHRDKSFIDGRTQSSSAVKRNHCNSSSGENSTICSDTEERNGHYSASGERKNEKWRSTE